MENWKEIIHPEFNHLYEVSDQGTIRKLKTKRILNSHIRNGYKAVSFYNPQTKIRRTVNIHRWVALTFIDNPHSYKMVNHKNGLKEDNCVHNLEWVTAQQNCQHALETKLQKPHPKKVKQFTLDGEYIKTFDSIRDAEKQTGVDNRRISEVCKGRKKSSGGFVWKHDTEEELIDDVDGKVIENFPNYKITKDGKVFSKRLNKFLIPKKLQSGYECVKLCNNKISEDFYIRKLVREYYPQIL